MNIETEDYTIDWDRSTSTVVCKGLLRLNGIEAHQPIIELLVAAAEQSETCTIDLRDLEFLNSSGISMLSMFVVQVRDKAETRLPLIGTQRVLWQARSLKNLQRLMPELQIELQ